MSNSKQPAHEPIAIVGMAAHMPGATNLKEYWSNILNQKDCITDIPKTHWDVKDYWSDDPKIPDKTYCKRGGFLPLVEFDPMEFGIAPKDLDVIDTAQLLGMKVARAAMQDAGYGIGQKSFDRGRTSAIVGTTSITDLATPLNMRLSYPTIEKILRKHGVPEDTISSVSEQYRESFPIWQENSFPGVLGNVISGRIANTLDLGGTNCVIDAACASALGALKMAVDALLAKTSDMVVTGGIDTVNNIFMYLCFSKTPAFSKEGFSRPFDLDSDGILIGEGLGLVVLKRYADAVRDGDRIYAKIASVGSSSDGKAKSIYQPVSEGQMKALRQAYEMAAVTPRTIGLMEAHGTGTPVGDAVEITGVRQVFGDASEDREWCALGSVKSQIGHTKASAGIAGLMKAALSLYHKVIPATINVKAPNPKLGIEDSSLYISTETRPWVNLEDHPRRAACSAFGFGGTNFHVVMEENEANTEEGIFHTGDNEVLFFSGKDQNELLNHLKSALENSSKAEDFSNLARYNQHNASIQDASRLAIVAQSIEDLASQLKTAIDHLGSNPGKALHGPTLFFEPSGSARIQGEVALAFPGQGSQHIGMARDLLLAYPRLMKVVDEFEAFRKEKGLSPLSTLIWPKPTFKAEEKAEQDEILRRTDNAQAALALSQLMLLTLLQEFGLKATHFFGHSFGEVSALLAAGRISRRDFMAIAHERGNLMLACAQNSEGTMAAVLAPLAKVETSLKAINSRLGTEVVLANRNSPEQGVISGKKSEVEKVSQALSQEGFKVKALNVSAAFHTPLMAPAVKKFGDFLAKIEFKPGSGTVWSNMTAEPYPQDAEKARVTLRDQLLYPVRFHEKLEALFGHGVTTFVECGAGTVCSGLIQATLGAKATTLNPLGRNAKIPQLKPFLSTLASLYSASQLELKAQAFGIKPENLVLKKKKSPVTVLLNGANYLRKETRQAPTNEPRKALSLPEPKVIEVPVKVPVPAPAPVQAAPKAPVPQKPVSVPAAPVAQKAVAPRPVTASKGSPMNRDHNQESQSVDALHQYRMRMLEVQEQFLRAQMESNRLLEQMISQQATLPALPRPVAAPLAAPQATWQEQHAGFAAPIAQPAPVAVAAPAPVRAPQPVPQAAAPAPSGSLLSSMFEKRPAPAPQKAAAPQPAKPAPVATPVAKAQPAPVAAAPVAQASGLGQEIEAFLMNTIAEKTGFPLDMLSSDMDLENDLAVDSIRRVEILGAVQEKFPSAPAIGPSQLGILKTIGDIVGYLGGGASTSAPAQAAAPAPQASSAPAATGGSEIEAFLMSTIAEKTGFPLDMLSSDMDLENDLAVDSIRRVEILGAVQEKFPSAPAIGPSQLGILKTIGDIVGYLGGASSAPAQAAAPAPQAAAPAQATGGASSAIQTALYGIISEKTGFPEDMLSPEMDLENDLAVDSIRRVEILGAMQERFPEAPSIGPSQLGVIRTIGDVIHYLSGGAQAQVGEKKN